MPLVIDEDFEAFSRKVRGAGGIEDRFLPDMLFFLNQLKQRKIINDYVRLPRSELFKDEAAYNSENKTIVVRDDVFDALDHPSRASKKEYRHFRFTIAHEVAHAAFDHQGVHFRGVTSEQVKQLRSRVGRHEREADRLASHILAPYCLAEQAMHALSIQNIESDHLSELFGINIRAAQIAAERTNRMYRRVHKVIRPLPKAAIELLKFGQQQGYTITSLAIEDRRRREEAQRKGFQVRPCKFCAEYTLNPRSGRFKCDTCGREQE